MQVWQAAILGIVQGLTEFLPVSSSGHILLFERIFKIETGMFLGIMLHAGTLIAVVVLYFSKICNLFKQERKKFWYLILATIPAGVVGIAFGDAIDRIFFGGDFLWLFFALTAILLFFLSARLKKTYPIKPLNAKRATAVGLAQAVAVLPGLSRSGTTLTACVFTGMEKEEAVDFSFLMSIPVIGGALLVEIFKVFAYEGYVSEISWQALAVGMGFSVIFGLIAVRWVSALAKKGGFMGFGVYLLILAAFLFANEFLYIF